ncbi:MAG: amidohydrolase family protein [Spirochaetaceae bacterium]|nr:amidohydrolase family protein [Myxococcales bacterium]MCB9726187.1 amidohydrolase family protein [Spirochaetaceae bacterium]
MHDLVLRGGTILDGSGGEAFEGDLAIDGDRLVAVGGRAGAGRREIDAAGLVVTPGFVDLHTHYDGQATWDALLEPSIYHGVTTVVMGNCGVGFAPAKPDRHEWLIRLMEGVEDIPGTALAEGLTWDWESFPEYLDSLERKPHALDLAAQLPHAALRGYVMGDRGGDHEERPTPDEIREMARLAREAIEAGAVGFTTSRTINHKTADGAHTPSYTATADELWGIAEGLRQAGAGVFEIVGDFPDLEPEFAMIRQMAERSGRPLSVTVAQLNERPEDWRRMLALIEQANAEGVALRAQVAPRPVGVVMSLESTFNPFSANPAMQALALRPLAERIARLRDPETRAAVVAGGMLMEATRLFSLGDPPCYEPPAEASFEAIARRTQRAPAEVALDVMLAEGGTGQVFMPALNYVYGNADHLLEMLRHPFAVPGLGDGGAHVSFISDASFPTYLLTHWARDRERGEKLSLPFVVKRQTQDTARLLGFEDRGRLAPGLKADLNVIDFERLGLHRPEMRYDLPAGGKRLVQRARGYRYTLVSGEVVLEDDTPTGATPGRLVRGAQPAPRAR